MAAILLFTFDHIKVYRRSAAHKCRRFSRCDGPIGKNDVEEGQKSSQCFLLMNRSLVFDGPMAPCHDLAVGKKA